MKNIEIYINGALAIIDDKTEAGVVLRNLDLTDPANRKQPYTNTIKFPVIENQHIFELASEPGYAGTVPFDRMNITIVVEGFMLLKNGIGYLQSIKEGYYELSIREQPAIIQTMRDTTLASLGGGSAVSVPSPVVQSLLNATTKTKLDIIFNETQYEYSVTNPTKFQVDAKTANYTYYVYSIFMLMQNVAGINFVGSLMTDTYFRKLRLVTSMTNVVGNVGNTFRFVPEITLNTEKTFFDLFKAVLQMFGAVYYIVDNYVIIDKFDDLTLSTVDWSSKLGSVTSKKFHVEKIAQTNYMRYKAGGDAIDELNQCVWTCENKNIESESVIIESDATVHPFISLKDVITGAIAEDTAIFLPKSEFDFTVGGSAVNKNIISEISDLIFVVDGTKEIPVGTIVELEYHVIADPSGSHIAAHTVVAGDNRTYATYYNSQNDYRRFASILEYPVVYEVELNLNVLDLQAYYPFNLVLMPELGGTFYLNKLQYNFSGKGKKSRATLIKYIEP